MPMARRGFLWDNHLMSKAILFIDGENFRHKVEEVLKIEEIDKDEIDFSRLNLNKLIDVVLKEFNISQKLFYGSRIHEYKETSKKSKELITLQRNLKTHLEKQGFDYVIAGNVRAQEVRVGKTKKLIFREKGVDVKIAVDMVAGACDGVMDTVILCSSDSDLQPAVKEVKKRGIKVVYLGFQTNPNLGLSHTSDQAILFRNSEIVEVCPKES